MNSNKMAAIILAGGRSSRMGENKMLLPLGDSTIVGKLVSALQNLFAEIIVVTDHPEAYQSLPVRVAEDQVSCSSRNSLTGIHGGLSVSSYEYNLVLAGDMPFVERAVLRRLCSSCEGHDVTVPHGEGFFQPLCAVYRKSCLPGIERRLKNGQYKILDFFSEIKVQYVDFEELKRLDKNLLSFFNVNTPEEYKRACEIFAAKIVGGW